MDIPCSSARTVVLRDRKVQLILGALDGSVSLVETAALSVPTSGACRSLAGLTCLPTLPLPRYSKPSWHIFVVTLLDRYQ